MQYEKLNITYRSQVLINVRLSITLLSDVQSVGVAACMVPGVLYKLLGPIRANQ